MATKIQIRRDTLSNWNLYNPILSSGEIAFVTDENKFKVGDGTSTFTQLPYLKADAYIDSVELGVDTTGKYIQNIFASDGISLLEEGSESASVTITNTGVLSLYSTESEIEVSSSVGNINLVLADTINANTTGSAATLTTARAISLGGDVSGSASFNGGEDITITATVADDSHNHIISNIDNLQTTLDGKQPLDADLTAIAALTATSGILNKISENTWSLDPNVYLTGNQAITISGDASGSGTTAIELTLANSGVSASTYGSSSQIPVISVDSKGRITSASVESIQGIPNQSGNSGKYLTTNGTSPFWDSINLGTDTDGDYVARLSVSGAGLSVTGSGESASVTLSNTGVTSLLQTPNQISVSSSAGEVTLSLPSAVVFPGSVTLNADPTQALHAATKQYVDEVAEGLQIKPAVEIATTANLSATYNNGTNGVGATLTATSNGAFPTIDGVTLASTTPGSNGVLVKNQSNPAHNGRYNLTQVGNSSTPWILTRCGLCDEADEIPGAYVFVKDGNLGEGTGWVAVVSNPATFTVGTDAVNFTQFSGAGTYTAGTGLDLNGNQFSNTGVLSIVSTEIDVSASTGNITLNLPATINADITGNAATATKLATARSIALSGDVSGSANFDGSSGISIAAVVADDSHNHIISNVDGLQAELDGKQPLDADLTAIAGLSGTSGFLKKTAANTWSLDTGTYLTGNQTITISGDASGSGTTAISLTLANSGVSASTYGSASAVPTFTVDAKGRITTASNTPIAIAQSAVTNLTSDLAAKAPLASPTFTGTVTVPTLSLTTADTATTATHYMVETATDGIVRPKTLANVRTEIVTNAAVNAAAATTVGTITSGTWAATDIGLAHGGTNASLTAANGAVVYSTSSALALTGVGTAGQVLTSNGAGAPTWQDPSGGGSGLESASATITANDTATTIVSFSASANSSAEMFIQQKQGTKMTTSKFLVMWDGTDVNITEFAVMDAAAGAANTTITASHNAGTISVTASSPDAATTNVIIKATVNYIAA